jgi:hypothetical protein
MALEAEAFDMEGLDEGEAAEFAEAAPRRGPRIGSSFAPRSFGQQPPVSQGQLQAALGRVDGNLRKVSDVETAISSRVSSLAAATKKETADRKKALDAQVKDLSEKLQLLALFPLLLQAPTLSNPQAGGQPLKDGSGNVITSISAPDPSKLDAILPLLLVSGMGTSTGTGGGGLLGGDGGGGSLLLLALVLAFSGK